MAASYVRLWKTGELVKRAEEAVRRLARCDLCPRHCHVDRLGGEVGQCRTGRLAAVSSYGPHYGEESPLVGRYGSGTVFIANCNLSCIFCQNSEISHEGRGDLVNAEQLAIIMLALQNRGCHNVNLVSPTHVVPQILEALVLAVEKGLRVPLVYNSGGYDALETLQLLDGVVDIYMPDMKYSDDQIAKKLSGVSGYVPANRAAVKEMHRQVGDLEVDERGIAVRGLLVRHLVLPGDLAGTEQTASFLAQQISPNSYLNVMDQYRPCFRAFGHPQIGRRITRDEYQQAIAMAKAAGLTRLDSCRSYRFPPLL